MAGIRWGMGCGLGLGVREARDGGEAVLQLRGPGGDWVGDGGEGVAVPAWEEEPSASLGAAGEGWPVEEPGRGAESDVGVVAMGVLCLVSAISLCISWGETTVTTDCIFSSTTPPDQRLCFFCFPPVSVIGPVRRNLPKRTSGMLLRLGLLFLLP